MSYTPREILRQVVDLSIPDTKHIERRQPDGTSQDRAAWRSTDIGNTLQTTLTLSLPPLLLELLRWTDPAHHADLPYLDRTLKRTAGVNVRA